MTVPEPALTLRNVTLGYDRRPAVHHLTGEVKRGALLALVGPNGAGKSTLLKGIAGELKPLGGTIELNDLLRCRLAYLPQQIEIDRSFPISVFDCAAMGLWREIGIWRCIDARRKRTVSEALAAVGVLDLANRSIGALSGGQFQRVLFARLILQDAPLILLDEPFHALDSATVADLVRLLKRWQAEGRTVIAALHDIDQVRATFPQTLLLAREPIAWGATASVLTPGNLVRARHSVAGWEEDAPVCDRDEQPLERQPA